MNFARLAGFLPAWPNALLATASALLLILAFPDFDLWYLAWAALLPLFIALDRERTSPFSSFALGWLWGVVFFFGSCWWLTFAPITYAGFPWPLAYFLLFCLTAIVGIFPGIFGLVLSVVLRRFGNSAFLAAPFIWVSTEFLRYWITGNNWNAVGYSQAFSGRSSILEASSIGGIYLSSLIVVFISSCLMILTRRDITNSLRYGAGVFAVLILVALWLIEPTDRSTHSAAEGRSLVVAIQPDVPMSGLTFEKWMSLRQKHVRLADSALRTLPAQNRPTTVIFPESPMNFTYEEDHEFRDFVHDFAAEHNVHVLFNSAEPDTANKRYFNSAVLVGPEGREIAQYDKIYLVPFGESVPAPLQAFVPALVGSFSYGNEYDLLPLGEAKAGVMICFESHFGELSREYVRRGADVIIEMTNDGYLGPTPVLRQHLANAVFRAAETNRPVLRVTNVGITAYINERGEVLDQTESYTEDTRVWSVPRSDGSQTVYVKYGDWFAWLCTLVTLGLTGYAFLRRKQ